MNTRIRDIARNLDAKRIKRFVADNKSLWNLEREATILSEICKDIEKLFTHNKKYGNS